MTDPLIEPILMPEVRVARSSLGGFGVYAGRDFQAGEIVEESPVIELPRSPLLQNYVFKSIEDQVVFALGYGSLYNHANEPNLDFLVVPDQRLIRFTANRPLVAGEELTIFYGANWFADRDAEPKPLPTPMPPRRRQYWVDMILLGVFAFLIIQLFF